MKARLLFASLLSAICLSASADIVISESTFPDENFRLWVLAQSYGQDGVLTDEEIANVTDISVNVKHIESLKGIECFAYVEKLYCVSNQLTDLDVSNLTRLTKLYCNENPLKKLDVSKNIALKELQCCDNQLTELDVSSNDALEVLHCSNNRLTGIIVSNNTSLTVLNCAKNQIATLDVSKNTLLERLLCSSNCLKALDATACTQLQSLKCTNNQLQMLDVSGCSELEEVYCYNNCIKGEAMDVLVNGLPINSTGWGHLAIISLEEEQNIMTKAQVAAAKAKGWIPRYKWGSFGEYWGWTEYEGSNPTGIAEVKSEAFLSATGDGSGEGQSAVYDLMGRKVEASLGVPGIYVKSGKKIAVK